MSILMSLLLLPDRIGDSFEVAVRFVPCARCDHSRTQHRHHRAGLDCSPRGGCSSGCRAFVWPSPRRVALHVWASR